jgi:thiol peroxidase
MARTTIMGGKEHELSGPEMKVGERAPGFNLRSKGGEVKLSDFAGKVLVLSVVPSLDTSVCALQTKRFNDEMSRMPDNVKFLTVSVDLPVAQARFCGDNNVTMQAASDHFDVAFGKAYGTLMPDMRWESRAVFVVDPAGEIKYVEYVPEVGKEPNYDAALQAIRTIAS